MTTKELLFVPLTKVDLEQRLVYGIAAQETADKSKEIMDYETSKPNFMKWSDSFDKATNGASYGNVREMHGKSAAGKLTSFTMNDVEKRFEVCAKVVDDQAWEKVKQGVYTGFSIGGSYAKRWQDGELTRYTASPSEVSLVDNPCIPTATFTMVKADGLTEQVTFKIKEKVISGKNAIIQKKFKTGENKMRKGMYGVSQLASVIEGLTYCQQCSEMEAMAEKDDSEVPAKLDEAIKMLGAILVQMAQEEVSELTETDEDDMTDTEKIAKAASLMEEVSNTLVKAGSRHNKADMESIQAIHDHSVNLGATHTDSNTEKMAKSDPEPDPEEKGAVESSKILKVLESLSERLSKIEAQPAALSSAKPHVSAFGKENDKVVKSAVVSDDPREMMKSIYAEGGKLLSKSDLSNYGATA